MAVAQAIFKIGLCVLHPLFNKYHDYIYFQSILFHFTDSFKFILLLILCHPYQHHNTFYLTILCWVLLFQIQGLCTSKEPDLLGVSNIVL